MFKKKNDDFLGGEQYEKDNGVWPRSGDYTQDDTDFQAGSRPKVTDTSKNNAPKPAKGAGCGIFLAMALAVVIGIGAVGFAAFSLFKNEADDFGSQIGDQLNDMGDFDKDIQNAMQKQEILAFNGKLELYKGTQSSFFVDPLLDNIVTANTKGVHVVELAFGDITTSKPEEIVNIKRSLKDNCEYEVLFYYDDVGFINKCVLTEYPAEK